MCGFNESPNFCKSIQRPVSLNKSPKMVDFIPGLLASSCDPADMVV